MRNLKLFCLLGVATWVAGCAFSKDSDKNKETDVTIRRDAEAKKVDPASITTEIAPKPDLNKYSGIVHWIPNADTTFQFAEYSGETSNQRPTGVVIEVDGGKGQMTFDLDGGQSRKFMLTIFNSIGGHLLAENIELVAPIDRDIVSNTDLQRNESVSVGRFVIRKGCQINTRYHSLTIDADELIVEGGNTLTTLSDNDVSITSPFQSGVSSLPAPTLTIHAKKATGHLEIKMRGYNSSPGDNGAEVSQSDNLALKGKPGTPGQSSERVCIKLFNVPCADKTPATCLVAPTDGQNGLPGRRGNPGADGHPGGDTGNLNITIDQHTDFTVELDETPGKGGRGGYGSAGEPGGKGGDAGINSENCPSAKLGHSGINGEPGARGADGSDGHIGQISLKGFKYYKSSRSADFENSIKN